MEIIDCQLILNGNNRQEFPLLRWQSLKKMQRKQSFRESQQLKKIKVYTFIFGFNFLKEHIFSILMFLCDLGPFCGPPGN